MNRRRARQIRIRRIKRIAYIAAAVLVVSLCAALGGRFWRVGATDASATPIVPLATTPKVTSTAETTPDADATPTGKPTPTAEPTASPDGTATPEPSATAKPTPVPPAPTPTPGPLAGIVIGIDPGHQDHGDGAQEPNAPDSTVMKAKVSTGTQGVSTRVPEYEVNLQVGLMLRDRLTALGAEVYMTREVNDISISNVERAQLLNECGVDLALRIHCNGSTDRSVSGVSLFVRKTGENADECFAAAEALLPRMLEQTGANDYGIHKSDTYTGNNWSVPPCVLVEMGFMSNPEEDTLLCDPEYQAKLVEGMTLGIADYFGRTIE